ncbi:MAG TPA: PEP-CTERM sorting domain-containing protein [Myxococcota bacterium]|nr:PEP-CTERM sorting domain-containing protein [Myxococcota bacterium]
MRLAVARRLCVCLLAAAALAAPARAASIFDDFESYAPGSFPSPTWSDVRSVALPNAPLPSAQVIATTDAFGHPTQALQTLDAVSPSEGIYTSIDPADQHDLAGDVRVDRYGTLGPGASPSSDWPAMLGLSDIIAGSDVCCFPTPQLGIYASTQTQGWRLYAIDAAGNATDIDLGAAAAVGTWYHVDLDVDALTGSVTSRVVDIATGTLVIDRTDVIPGWTATDFDAIAFFDGELSEPDVAGLGSLDNVSYAAVPEPGTLSLVSLGLVAASLAWRRPYPK